MVRPITLGVCIVWLSVSSGAGEYAIAFDLPDQALPFDTFGDPPASVLAPAGVYQGLSDTTVLELAGGNLVAGNPDGGGAGEYSALALLAEPPGATFSGGAVARSSVAGATLEAVRDGAYPGLAIGMTMVDENGGTYFLAAINRTQAGADYFDNALVGGVVNRNALVPGTGYYAVWELNAVTPGTVLAVAPIPAGTLAETEFRIDFDSGGGADFRVGGTILLADHALGGQPDRAGLIVMSWGTMSGNPAYSGVTFGTLRASGPQVPDGGVPGLAVGGIWTLSAMATFVALAFVRALRRVHGISAIVI
jgi:hypothetical protein